MLTDRPRCARCSNLASGWNFNGRLLCGYCARCLTSLHAQIGLAQGKPVAAEQREWLWQWFLTTTYFAFHRRMSRGRAKKLLEIMRGVASANPANVATRGPNDLVTDATPLQATT